MRVRDSIGKASCLLASACWLGVAGCAVPRSLASKNVASDSIGAKKTELSERLLAITVDDLPWVGKLAPGDSPVEANRRLLAEFSTRGLHVTGFVVCGNVDANSGLLEAWLTSGMDLGNHTAHHLDLNRTDLLAWIEDMEECHERLSLVSKQPPQFFRYPMLHQGNTHEKRSGAAAALKRRGYPVAHVTVDNSEWLLAAAYGRALQDGDTERQEQIATAYVDHILSGVEHFDTVARAELGRWPPHILLVHANALAADHIGRVLDALNSRGVRIVPLSDVLADPAFSLDDKYIGPKGISWLYRTSPGAFERWGTWDDTEAELIRARFPEQ